MRTILTTIAACGLIFGVAQAKEVTEVTKDAVKKECSKDSAKCSKSKATFAVAGMTCGGCEGKLTKMLKAVDGVDVNAVCSKSGKACVNFDADKVSKKELMDVVTKSGFKLQGEMVSIPVKNMTCGGCSSKVKNAIAALDGVSGNAVCHKSGKATVTFDPAKTSKDKIVAAINTTPFKTAK